MIEEPDFDRAVFIRVVSDMATPAVIGDETVELEKGSVLVMRYNAIAKHLEVGDVEVV
jgi:GINS complex subunit 4